MIGSSLYTESSLSAKTLSDAEVAARHAAAVSGVRLRPLETLEEFDASIRLYDGIWHAGPNNPPVTRELLRALTKSGNYVVGAFDDVGLVGAGFALFCAPREHGLHSHIAGVSLASQRRGVGFALKVHQRAWALSRGVTSISWTFDPLVRRNAHFNLVKLRASAREYLPNFYGSMSDEVNGADESDRLLVTWDLLSPAVAEACRGPNAGVRESESAVRRNPTVGVGLSSSQRPVSGSLDAGLTAIAVPTDIEALRALNRQLAAEWRNVLRDSLGTLLATGARIISFDDEVGYLVSSGRPSGS